MAEETYSIDVEVDAKDVRKAARETKKLEKAIRAMNKASRQGAKQHAFNLKIAGIKEANKPMAKLSSLVGKLAPALFTAAAGAAALAGALVVGVGMAVTKFSQAVIGAKQFNIANNQAFKSLLGSASAGAEAMTAATSLADKYGFKLQDVAGSMKKLLAAQFSLEESKTFVKMGADLRAIGTDAEGVKSAVRAITQIKAKGRLQSDELLQLSEANVSQQLIFDQLKKSLGLDTTDEVRKLLEAGKIKSDTAIQAILGAVGKKTGSKEAGDAGEEFAKISLEAMRNRIENSGFQVFRDVAESSPEAFKRLAEIGNSLSDFFKNMDRGKLGSIFETAIAAFDAFTEVGKAFLTGFVDGLADGADSSQTFFDMMKDPEVIEGIKSAGKAFALIADALIKVSAAAVKLGGSKIFSLASVFTEQSDSMYSGGGSLAANLVSGFASGIANGRGVIGSAVSALAQSAISAFGGPKGIDAHSPSKVFEDFGGDVVDGFGEGLKTPSQAAATNGGAPTPEVGGGLGATNNFNMGGLSVNTEVNEAGDGAEMASQMEKSAMAIFGRAFEAMALQGGAA